MGKEDLKFKYQRKRIITERILRPLCADYKPIAARGSNCQKAKLCKNATYGSKNIALGTCYGGTKENEQNLRKQLVETGGLHLR